MADLSAVRPRSVFGVLCTYRRPGAVAAALDAIDHQTLGLDRLVVVDNDSDPAVRELVEARRSPCTVYVGLTSNRGPAGAFNAGLAALSDTGPDDLVVLFDDDDPPVSDDSIRRLVALLDEQTAWNRPVAGVGLRGGRLDLNRGRVRPPAGDRGVVDVDHLHGGYLPVYRLAALGRIGGFDSELFWGFEELDLGQRLTAAGYELIVDLDHWQDVAARYPKARARRGTRLGVGEPTPGRYYSLRNLLRVLGQQRAWWAVVRVVAVRAVGKPLVGLVVRPRRAMANLAVNLLAVGDAARGRMGRRDRFPGPCGLAPTDPAPGRAA